MTAGAAGTASETRLDEVSRRGALVMPFELARTLHVFTKTKDGGIQQVIVKNESDTQQVSLIRAHLQEIANQFRQGDFSGPMTIHGRNMPGLEALTEAEPGAITISYASLPKGGQIIYRASDPHLVLAIHQWFDAQLQDHARHAVPGHKHHLMTDR